MGSHTGVSGYYNRYHTWKGQAKYIASYIGQSTITAHNQNIV